MAVHLATHFWGDPSPTSEVMNTSKILTPEVSNELKYKLGHFSLIEIKRIIKTIKRRKAAGLDDLSSDILKDLNDSNLKQIKKILDDWWDTATVPEEELYARIALIFKKGKTDDLANYRPIAILGALYKLYAACIRNRIVDQLDEHLQSAQYGFRKKDITLKQTGSHV